MEQKKIFNTIADTLLECYHAVSKSARDTLDTALSNPYVKLILSIILLVVIIIVALYAYRAIRDSWASIRNTRETKKKTRIFQLAKMNYKYFCGFNTTYLFAPQNKTYDKYKYQVAAAATDSLCPYSTHALNAYDKDKKRYRKGVFFLQCVSGRLTKHGHTLIFADPYGEVETQTLFGIDILEVNEALDHFCIVEMKYYPDTAFAEAYAIHVTNLTDKGYINAKGKPYGVLKQKLFPMWEITNSFTNLEPGVFLPEFLDEEDIKERRKEYDAIAAVFSE